MELTGTCSSCQGQIRTNEPSGKLTCPACSEELWYCQFEKELVNTTKEQIEGAFGFQVSDFTTSEVIEILRFWREERDQELAHLWNLRDSERKEILLQDSENPYQPPGAIPRRHDWKSDTIVFRAIVPTHDANLEWATTSYGSTSSVAALVAFGAFIFFIGNAILFDEQFEWMFSIATSSWSIICFSMALAFVILPKLPRLIMSPYIKLIRKRCQQDRLYAEAQFQLIIRPTTITVHSDFSIATWPLREVWCPHHDNDLMVLRVEPSRLLFIPSNSWTIPEPFEDFNRGVRRRIRRYWKHHLLRAELN